MSGRGPRSTSSISNVARGELGVDTLRKAQGVGAVWRADHNPIADRLHDLAGLVGAKVPNELMKADRQFGRAIVAVALAFGALLHDRGPGRSVRRRDARGTRNAMRPLRFHERMSGWLSFEQHSYNQAVAAGRRSHNACSQELEIEIDDLDRFLSEPDHAARAEGIVHCDQLGGGLSVQPGSSFNLFVDAGGARHKRMLYRLYLVDTAGRELTLSGFKDLEDDPNLDVWGDTSRLLIRILSGRVEREPIGDESTVATGILYISRVGLLRMLSSAVRGDRHCQSGGALQRVFCS